MAVDLPDWQTRAAIGTDTPAGSFTLTPGSESGAIDTTGLQSLVVGFAGQSLTADATISVQWRDAGDVPVFTDIFVLHAVPVGFGLSDLTVPCRTDRVTISMVGGSLLNVTLTGSQRPPDGVRYGALANFYSFVNASAAMVAGNFYVIGGGTMSSPGGWMQLDFEVSGNTATGTLYAQLQSNNGSAALLALADTAESHLDVSDRFVLKQVILPAGELTLTFFCRTSGTADIVCNLAPLLHG